MKTNWKLWVKCALIRAVKTIAQTAVALIGVGSVMEDIDWVRIGSAAVLAGILSILTSIAGLPEVELAEKAEDNESCYVNAIRNENELREALYPPETYEQWGKYTKEKCPVNQNDIAFRSENISEANRVVTEEGYDA